jgi:hypothetical protein
MSETTDEERELRMALMRADIDLKRKQVIWETPRNIAIMVGAVAAISAAIAGWTGYQIGRSPPAPPQLVLPPGTIIQVPPAAKP